ncbi:MAG: ABC transporter substrate-binding protein [Candidatus Binataceae bacterium]
METVEPVARAIERAAEIEQEGINGGHAGKSLSAPRLALKWRSMTMLGHCAELNRQGLTSPQRCHKQSAQIIGTHQSDNVVLRINLIATALAFSVLVAHPLASNAWCESADRASHEEAQQAVRHLIDSIKRLGSVRDSAERVQVTDSINRSLALNGVAERALGPQWSSMSDAQRLQFVLLLSRTLERLAYPQASQFYSTLKTEYRGQESTPAGTVVKTMVARPEGGAVSIDYLVVHRDGRRQIADVILDGQGLAGSIASQIHSVVTNGSYELLMQQMQAQLAQPVP